jgi:rod shape-determining protein MreD
MRPANYPTIYLSLAVALLCQLFPWYGQGIIIRPDFMLVTMLYWLLRSPNMCNIGTAWFVGLLVDLSTGSLLGQHALSFSLTAYLGLLYQRRLVLFNQWQLFGYVLTLLLIERSLVLVLKLFAGNDNPGLQYIVPVLTGLILWKFLIVLFGAITRPRT